MTPPASICLLRTSAIGDVTHVVPLLRTLQSAWPGTRLTWVIGKLERKLVGDLPDVEFVTFDKAAGWAGMRFCEPLGLHQTQIRWDIPISDAAHAWASTQLPGTTPTLVVSPSASHTLRNWRPERYAAVMDHAAARGWRVVLVGGPSSAERVMADAVLAACKSTPLDLTGKDTLKKLLALLSRAQLVLTPDSGPMHMANAVGTRVLGLHAASNPDRSGPYSDRRWCVNKYDAAARKYFGKAASELPWGIKIEKPGVMDLIRIDDVIERYEAAARDLGFA